jgi:2-dehydro-3-deoxyglucarate aldolase/4-hydroxy-2-oxoheptanedioate aldolase
MNTAALSRFRERTQLLGTWLSIGSPVIAELAAESGFDWLLFDLEHGCGSEAALLGQLQALRSTSAAAIVRVGAPHADLIARVLDWGADGIMVPHVSTAAEAEACVRAMRYPPHGTRGFSRSVRAYGYGLRPPDAASLPQPLLFAQVETLEAVENARAIAAVDGVDGVDVLFVGPADLQFDLGTRAESATRTFADCLRHVAQAAAEADKLCGILVRDRAELPRLRELGFTHLAIDSDLGILRAGWQRIMASHSKTS